MTVSGDDVPGRNANQRAQDSCERDSPRAVHAILSALLTLDPCSNGLQAHVVTGCPLAIGTHLWAVHDPTETLVSKFAVMHSRSCCRSPSAPIMRGLAVPRALGNAALAQFVLLHLTAFGSR